MRMGMKTIISWILIVSAMLTAAVSANAQIYSGRAVGVNAATTISGSNAVAIAADTGQLPITGGNVSVTVPSSSMNGVFTTGVIASNTSGILKSSQSASIVSHFDFSINGLRIQAKRIAANATCICCPGSAEAACIGGVQINGLTITDSAGNETIINVTGQANQAVTLPNGSGTLVINEQASSFETISVNGLHITAARNGNTYDIRVASITTNISCAVALPTPAKVTVSGRVLTSGGSPLPNSGVTLTDAAGNKRSTSTNSFGAFTFDEVEVGSSYILQALRKGYDFDPVILSLEDTVSVDIRARP